MTQAPRPAGELAHCGHTRASPSRRGDGPQRFAFHSELLVVVRPPSLFSPSPSGPSSLSMARTPPPRQQADNQSDGDESDSDNQTDPKLVTKLAPGLLHECFLGIRWQFHHQHQMCYIFDFVTPGMQWKRGTVYTDEDPWVDYGPSPWPDLTESDEAELPQKPYYPKRYV